jgi:hypothetical protein
MIRAEAWPFPVYGELTCRIDSVSAGGIALEPTGYFIDARSLRGQGSGTIHVALVIETPVQIVITSVFGTDAQPGIQAGVKVLCEGSKFRAFRPCDAKGRAVLELDLKNLEGIVQLDPVMVLTSEAEVEEMKLAPGTVIATAPEPVRIVIDQSLTGDALDVQWVDFNEKQYPPDAFFHVVLPPAGDETPVVLLNACFRKEIEPVIIVVPT